MNVSTIISQFRDDISTDEFQTPDDIALVWLNRVYRDLINDIRQKINEDYFYNEWKANTVINQREYTLVQRWTIIEWIPQDWMNKIKWISVKYKSTDTEYTKLRPETLSNLDNDLSWYETNQPASDWFYIISDKSVFIYPVPTEAVINWIKFYWIADPLDLTLTSTENDIKIPLEYHDLLLLWMQQYYFKRNNMINEKNDAKIEYQNEKQRMLSDLTDRIITPLISVMPNLSHLS